MPPALNVIFQRLMAKKPEDRFASMNEVVAAWKPSAPSQRRRDCRVPRRLCLLRQPNDSWPGEGEATAAWGSARLCRLPGGEIEETFGRASAEVATDPKSESAIPKASRTSGTRPPWWRIGELPLQSAERAACVFC